MKHFKKMLTAFILSNIFINCNTYAKTFNDVPKEHLAYEYIENMADLGILVGDLSGNFNPDANISKFDALKIIATLSGYNFDTQNEIEKEYYIDLNEKYKDEIAIYESKYSKWNSSVSCEIAYLLEKGIIKIDELAQFIVLTEENEFLRALSKEEICLYLVRIMGLEEEVNKMTFEETLKDSKNIAKDKLNSIYYLESLGIVTTDGGYFYPKNAITKAELSIIITNFLNYTNINISNDYEILQSGENIYTQFVNIEKVYDEINTIQVILGCETKVYKLDENTNIKINGKSANLSDISEGSYAELTFNDYLISSLNVDTTIINQYSENDKYKIIKGTIENINKDSIAISYRGINSDGFLEKEIIEIISFGSDYQIIKNGNLLSTEDFQIGDIATVVLYNNLILEMRIDNENSMYMGELIESSDRDKYIIIKINDDTILKLELGEECEILKNGQVASLFDLKIGDRLTITTEQNTASSIFAFGEQETKSGIVTSIKIYEQYATITLQNTENINDLSTYYLNTDQIDIYSIKILDKISVNIDSRQIYSLNIIERN